MINAASLSSAAERFARCHLLFRTSEGCFAVMLNFFPRLPSPNASWMILAYELIKFGLWKIQRRLSETRALFCKSAGFSASPAIHAKETQSERSQESQRRSRSEMAFLYGDPFTIPFKLNIPSCLSGRVHPERQRCRCNALTNMEASSSLRIKSCCRIFQKIHISTAKV